MERGAKHKWRPSVNLIQTHKHTALQKCLVLVVVEKDKVGGGTSDKLPCWPIMHPTRWETDLASRWKKCLYFLSLSSRTGGDIRTTLLGTQWSESLIASLPHSFCLRHTTLQD